MAIYNQNAPESVAVALDLLERSAVQRVKRACGNLRGIDLLAAGPPCKGFSQLRNGYHQKASRHNRVLLAIPEYVAALKPRFFLIENVPDLARHRSGKTLAELIGRLTRPGPRGLRYRVDHKVFDAAVHGTPQVRRRIFIFGARSGESGSLPDPGPNLAALFAAMRRGRKVPKEWMSYRSLLANVHDCSIVPARYALSDLPRLGPGEGEKPRRYATKPRSGFQRLMREGASEYLSNTQTPEVRRATVSRLKKIPPGGCARDIPAHLLDGLSRRFDSAYRRLHPDAPSTALSTKYDCVYHYAYARSLSLREYARLQGIPDFVTFPAALACRRSAYEMIGNSVPPLLVRAILGEALQM